MNTTASRHTRNMARNAGIISAATLLSRILGFLRDLILATTLGAGPVADAFFVAFRLPNVLRRLFAEGSLTMAFVPVYTKSRREEGKENADLIARSVQVWLLIILFSLSLGAFFFSEQITSVIAPGFQADTGVFDLTAQLVRICFPYIVLISSVALCMGILNSRGHFLAPALAPCVLNITLIVAAGIAYLSHLSVAITLAWAVIVAGFGQWLLQQPFLAAKEFTWKGNICLRHTGVKQVGRLMLPTILGAAAYQLNILIGTMLASMLQFGSVSYLYYADRLVQFPLGVFGVAISTAALPSLSSLAGENHWTEFKNTLNTSMTLTLFITIPAAAGLIGLGRPLIAVLFGHGEFNNFAVSATDLALLGYALGLPAFSCVRTLISSFYALEDTRTPVIISVLCMLLNIASGYLLMQKLDHLGLALAVSLASWTNVILLVIFLNRKIGKWGTIVAHTRKTVLLSLLILATAVFMNRTLPSEICVAAVPFMALLYFLLALRLRIPEAELISSGLRKKFSGSRKQK